jgi:putative membrane protein insertion efficiency factor
MHHLLIKLIRYYQTTKTDNHNPTCIYYPSCSEYAVLSLKKYSLLKAIVLILKRIWRCDMSKNNGGYDYP